MIAIPSIALIGLLGMMSMVGAVILRRPWQKITALVCAAVELIAVITLIIEAWP